MLRESGNLEFNICIYFFHVRKVRFRFNSFELAQITCLTKGLKPMKIEGNQAIILGKAAVS